MRRSIRSFEADEPLSLNSLLDTLMNVVGVSLILLAAADLSLIRTTKQIESSHIPRDISQRLAAERTDSQRAGEKADSGAIAADADEAEQRKRLLARLKLLEDEPARMKELLEKLTLSQQSLKALQDESASLDAKIDGMKAEIAKLSDVEAHSAHGTTIQLPVRRSVAKDLEPVTVVCRNGRVLILNYNQISKAFTDAMQTAQARLTNSMTLTQQVRAVISYFDTADAGNQSFRLSVQPAVENQQLRGFLVSILPRKPDPAARESAATSGNDASLLQRLNPASQYIQFLVWEDSFQLYLTLRGEIEKYYASAGGAGTRIGLSWIPYAVDEEVTRLVEVGGSSGSKTQNSTDAKRIIIDN